MDINSLYTAGLHDEGAEIQVKDQFGEKTDCYIKIVGPDSKRFRDIEKQNIRSLVAAIKGEDTEDVEDNKNEIDLAKLTLGWRGFTDKDKPLEFSTEAAIVLYVQAPYIVKQLNKELLNRANFMQSSAKK